MSTSPPLYWNECASIVEISVRLVVEGVSLNVMGMNMGT
jgi:hypothetical protein